MVMSQLIEQLKVYHAQWQKKLQTKEALSLSSEIRKPLASLIHDPSRSSNAPPIHHHTPTPQIAKKGFLDGNNTANMQPAVQITAPTPNPPTSNPSRAEPSCPNASESMITSPTPPIAAPALAESTASISESQPFPLLQWSPVANNAYSFHQPIHALLE